MESNIIINHHSGEFKLTYDQDLKFSIPEEIAAQYELALEKWKHIVKFNSIRAKPFQYIIDEGHTSILAGPFSYVETRALQECLQDQKNCHLLGVEKEISSLSLTVSVVSNEGLMLCALRSPKVSRYPELWSVGLGEGLEDSDFKQGNISQAVKRSLEEELSLHLDDNIPTSVINFIGTSYNTENGGLNILALVNLKGQGEQYSSANILSQRQNAPDAWEHIDMQFVEPDIEAFNRTTNNLNVPGTSRYLEMIATSIKN